MLPRISPEPGAQGGSESPAADALLGAPSDDDSALGDSDQHSTDAGQHLTARSAPAGSQS